MVLCAVKTDKPSISHQHIQSNFSLPSHWGIPNIIHPVTVHHTIHRNGEISTNAALAISVKYGGSRGIIYGQHYFLKT